MRSPMNFVAFTALAAVAAHGNPLLARSGPVRTLTGLMNPVLMEPTAFPSLSESDIKIFQSPRLCGFIGGDAARPMSCMHRKVCVFKAKAVACCPSGSGIGCRHLYNSCVDLSKVCKGPGCPYDVQVLTCDQPEAPYCATYHFSKGQNLLSCAPKPAFYSVEYVSDYQFPTPTALPNSVLASPTTSLDLQHQDGFSESNGTLPTSNFNPKISVNRRPLNESNLPAQITEKSLWTKVKAALLRVADLIGKKIANSPDPEVSNNNLHDSYPDNATDSPASTLPFKTFNGSATLLNDSVVIVTKTTGGNSSATSFVSLGNATHQYASRSRVNASMNVSSTSGIVLSTSEPSPKFINKSFSLSNDTIMVVSTSNSTSNPQRFSNITTEEFGGIQNKTLAPTFASGSRDSSLVVSTKTSFLGTATFRPNTSGIGTSDTVRLNDIADPEVGDGEQGTRTKSTISSFDSSGEGYADWVNVGGGATQLKVDGKSHDLPEKSSNFVSSKGSVTWHNSWEADSWAYDEDDEDD